MPLWIQLVALIIPAGIAVYSARHASKSAKTAQRAEHDAARLRDLEQRVAEQKAKLYQPMVKLLGELLSPQSKAAAEKRMMSVIVEFQTFVTIWGSDEVNEAFYRFRSSSATDPPGKVTVRLVSDFLLAVRRDVAWPDTTLDGLHTVGTRINDLAEDPATVHALTAPLGEVFEAHGWTPPFPMRQVGKLEAYPSSAVR